MNQKKVLSVLERIAKTFPPRSKEYKAIEAAAHAVLYIDQVATFSKFQTYLKSIGKEMTKDDLKYLKRFGLKNDQ